MRISNPSAFHDYTISERFEAGVKLSGPEVKSVKGGHLSLKGSFVRLVGTEMYLVNATVSPYTFASVVGYDPRRTRKLLLHKREIMSLKGKLDTAPLTLIPISIYTRHGIIKLEVGLAKGKKQFEKRESIKKRDSEREIRRFYRGKLTEN